MSHTLTAADLGEVGESTFKLLCDQAGLTCNKSTRDVTGWDFIVEFPMAQPGPDIALDQRPTAACHVQLKSSFGGGDSRVSLRLSSVERLAKDARAAFIVVFLFRSNGSGMTGFVIHLVGEMLSRVLKRLRQAQARKAFDVNHASIAFDYRKNGIQFSLTPQGIRNALANACGNDPADYVIQKQRQLEELGYENGRIQGEALFWVEGPEHLNKILLGLTPVKPNRLNLFDSRFDIRIPYQGPLLHTEEFTINPPYVGEYQVSFRGPGFVPAAIFSAEAFIGPPINEIGGPQLLIRNSDFALRIGGDRVEFETLGNFHTATKSLQQWIELIRALTYLASGGGSITIFAQQLPRIALPVLPPIDGPYIDQLPQLIRFLEGWKKLLGMAGVTSSSAFSIDEIFAARSAILAVDLLANSAPTACFEFQNLGDYDLTSSTVHGLYFNSGKLGDAAISYSVKVAFHGTGEPVWQYRSSSFEYLDIRPVVDEIEEYGTEQAESHGLRLIINLNNLSVVPGSD